MLRGVPAGPVAVAVYRDMVRRCLQRKVGRREGQIVEERFSRVVSRMIDEALHGVVADCRGDIEIGGRGHLLTVLDDAFCGEIVVVSRRHVERPCKALRTRVAVDMPLAGVI